AAISWSFPFNTTLIGSTPGFIAAHRPLQLDQLIAEGRMQENGGLPRFHAREADGGPEFALGPGFPLRQRHRLFPGSEKENRDLGFRNRQRGLPSPSPDYDFHLSLFEKLRGRVQHDL